jgi:hypothetical protein
MNQATVNIIFVLRRSLPELYRCPAERWYESTKTPFKMHTSRVRRNRPRLP